MVTNQDTTKLVGRLHGAVVATHIETYGEEVHERHYDAASDLAADLIFQTYDTGRASFDYETTTDDLGTSVTDDLHTLLVLIQLRSPEIARQFERLVHGS